MSVSGPDERRDVSGTENRPAVASTAQRGSAGRGAVAARRSLLAAGTGVAVLALAGCTDSQVDALQRLGLPVAASDRAPHIHDLWIGTWIAAGAIGVLVWGLIAWVSFRYRARGSLLPKQNRYNLPMEVFYTLAPFIIIGVLFYYTILAQDRVTAKVPEPDHQINVVGQRWSWTFNYAEADNPAVGSDVWESGTISENPNLYLPVGKSVRFTLSSPDVNHSFWIPAFYEKLDVIPGRLNTFDVTPNKEGVFVGKCAELCGTYHYAMLFSVHIVSEQEYNAHLKGLVAIGQTGTAKGPAIPDPQGSAKINNDRERVGEK
jgi:cytochrome c oxidase subunit 2